MLSTLTKEGLQRVVDNKGAYAEVARRAIELIEREHMKMEEAVQRAILEQSDKDASLA